MLVSQNIAIVTNKLYLTAQILGCVFAVLTYSIYSEANFIEESLMNVDLFLGGDTSQPLNINLRTEIIRLNCGDDTTSIVEVGCGSGGYFDALRNIFSIVTGLEPNTSKIEKTVKNNKIIEGTAEKIPFEDGSFSNVLINEVLEHVADDDLALRETHRILGVGGRLFLFAPNHCYPFESHGFLNFVGKSKWMWVPGLKYFPSFFLGFFGVKKWARGYFKFALSRRLEKQGFYVVKSGYIPQTFENISGQQPLFLRRNPRFLILLRRATATLSKIPVFNALICVSFYVVAEKKKSSRLL